MDCFSKANAGQVRPSLVDWQGWNHVSRRMACMHVDTCHEQPEQVEIPETDEGLSNYVQDIIL